MGKGYTGNVGIISKDDGFQSLRDYWTTCAVPVRRVLVSESIERSVISANEPSNRTVYKKLKTCVKL